MSDPVDRYCQVLFGSKQICLLTVGDQMHDAMSIASIRPMSGILLWRLLELESTCIVLFFGSAPDAPLERCLSKGIVRDAAFPSISDSLQNVPFISFHHLSLLIGSPPPIASFGRPGAKHSKLLQLRAVSTANML